MRGAILTAAGIQRFMTATPMVTNTRQGIYSTTLKASLARGFFLPARMPHFPIPYLVLKLNSNYVCAGRVAND